MLTPSHSAYLHVLTAVAALAACNSTPPAVVSPSSPQASAAEHSTTAPVTSAAIVAPAESQPVSVELPTAKEICVGYQSPMEQDARNVSSVRKFRWLRPPCDPSRSQDLHDYRDCVPGVHEACADLQLEGHSYRVRSSASSTSYAVLRDNEVIFRGALTQPYAFAPLYNLSLWDGKWVLEVNEDILIDGVSLNQKHGYGRSYHWVLWRGHPLYFFEQDGNVRISYAERTLPGEYSEVLHHQCCSGMMFNAMSCGERTSFYAKRGTKWYMVDLVFASPGQELSDDDRDRTATGVTGQVAGSFPSSSNMVLIPGGTFQMGTRVAQVTETGADEAPAHDVQVATFYLDKTEVTVEAYNRCVTTGKCPKPGNCNWGNPAHSLHPINCVNWSGAQKFCAWAGKRLPTEPEWEYAARGREGRKYPWGAAQPDSQLCWHRQHAEGTCPVGSFPDDVTPEGVLDMGGSVMEWVSSAYCSYETKLGCDSRRVARGCSHVDVKPYLCRGARRNPVAAGNFYNTLGFRCALSPPPSAR